MNHNMNYVYILHIPTGQYVNCMEHPDPVYFTTVSENCSFSTDLEYYLDEDPFKFLLKNDLLESIFYFFECVHGVDQQEFELIYRGSVSCEKYQIIKHLKKPC